MAQNLRYLREREGLSQRECAEIFGLSGSAVTMWEQDQRKPDIEMIVRLAEHFGVTLDELILKDLKPPFPLYASNIKYLRKVHGITQEDIGKLFKVTQKCVDKYEKGECAIDIEKLTKAADFFGVTLDQLVKQDLAKEGVGNGKSLAGR